jgi:hypothetical protein
MADYHCWPLWRDDEVGNVDPELLPLSDDLKARLNGWQAEYDRSFNIDDPANSPGVDDPEAFDVRERELAIDVAAELGSEFKVRYWKPKQQFGRCRHRASDT